MKNTISTKKAALAGALFVMLSATTAFAQTMRVSVPFPFKAGETALPPGSYVVKADAACSRLAIHSLDGKAGTSLVVVHASRTVREDTGKLIFRKYGSTYFLGEMWGAAQASGVQLMRSKVEQEMARTHGRVELAAVPSFSN